jgi:predicted dehydrogenase
VRLPEDGVLGVVGNVGDSEAVRLDMRVVKAYKDFNELLKNSEVELIDLCVPTSLHPQLAIAALQAGKHVICEKPMARTSALARDMVAAAKSAKGYFMPAMTYGKVYSARFRRMAEPPGWSKAQFMNGQQSGGALLDLHVHDVDIVQFCFGRPKSVFATGYTKLSGAIDHVVAQYEVDSGAIVHAEGSWAMAPGFGFSMAYTVNFENATADFDIARGADALKLMADGKTEIIKGDGSDGYQGELGHIIECIQNGRPPSVVTGQDGLSSVEICEAEERSIATRQAVMLG